MGACLVGLEALRFRKNIRRSATTASRTPGIPPSGQTPSQPFAGTGRACAKSCKADQTEVEALEMACCTADPCLGGVRPQALPTLLHSPDSRQHHNPPDHMTDRRRWVNQPQVPLLKQSTPQPALHLSADSLSNRTLPESMLPQPFAIPMGTWAYNTTRAWG
jgi:hypothetical protein